jgi:bifunctional enzyme CysN/CysC
MATSTNQQLLRFLVAGEGKSTLIARLLCDSGDAVPRLSAADGGLRSFSTARRAFMVVDAEARGQRTRAIVTDAATADLAVLLVDARTGIGTATRRHAYLAAVLGLGRVVLAVNQLDLVDDSAAAFAGIVTEFRRVADAVGLSSTTAIPLSARHGDNVATPATTMPWYDGPTLLAHLESVEIPPVRRDGPFRLPVQQTGGPDLAAGVIVGGTVRPGDRVKVLPSGRESTVTRVVTDAGDQPEAAVGQPVTLTLRDEIESSPGDVVAGASAPCGVADQFEARIIWLDDAAMLPGRSYLLRLGARTVGATLARPKHKVNVHTLEQMPAKTLKRNEIGVCNINLSSPIPFDPYEENRAMGRFALIDRFSDATVAVGIIHFALRRADNIHWQAIDVNKEAHAALKGQRPCVIWFTGISGAGKSAIANIVERKLHELGHHTYLLDGDNVRHGLNKDLGFTDADRVENIRRVTEVVRLMVDAGLIVLVSFISPFRAERQMARDHVEDGEFVEVHVDTALEVAEARDVKGLYAKARRGELKNFTGIDSPYERPEDPEIHIDTALATPEAAADRIIDHLRYHRNIGS